MRPLFDTLASVLEAGSYVSLTIVDRAGCVHTRPGRALRGPFRGQIWLRLGRDRPSDLEFEDGAEATVSFSGAADGPYVTVKGWAAFLPAANSADSTAAQDDDECPGAGRRGASPLVCITATAAQLWESLSGMGPRVFAFPAVDPHTDDMGAVPIANACVPRPERCRIAAKQSA